MEPVNAKAPVIINLGCGFKKLPGMINVDAFDVCEPDVVWDLNKVPFPFDDHYADQIIASHVFEHLIDWWPALKECARILKVGGTMLIRVPDESSETALAYRDHHNVFSLQSFHGIADYISGTNAWAATQENRVPLKMVDYQRVPFNEYQWMVRWAPWLLRFCAKHMRNFIWEQRFYLERIGENGKV